MEETHFPPRSDSDLLIRCLNIQPVGRSLEGSLLQISLKQQEIRIQSFSVCVRYTAAVIMWNILRNDAFIMDNVT